MDELQLAHVEGIVKTLAKTSLNVTYKSTLPKNPPTKSEKRKRKAKNFFLKLFPPLFWFMDYIRNWKTSIRGDLIAGITVGVMLIPQSMAYATSAGLPPIYGKSFFG